MTNHTHLIVVPSDAAVLSRAVGEAHRRYTRMKNFSDGVRGYLFQGRFASCVLDEGRPAGSEQFIEMIERLTGRDLMLRKAGRPLKRAS